jgi:hypothetical protein
VEETVRKLSIACLIVLAACSKEERSMPAAQSVSLDRADTSAAKPGAAAQSFVSTEAPQRGSAPLPATRMIVRTANVRVVVDDTARTVDAVTKAVEAMGGFVAASNVWQQGELLRATLTLRVPSDKLTPALAAIRGVSKRVEKETVSSEDVSEQYVDLDARVRNLEATEEELRQLLVVARQNSKKATDVLEVHQQLTLIRGEIEQARGRMRYLSQVAAMSSITLDVVPDAIAQPVVEAGWRPLVIAKNAVRALVGALQSIATVAIWFTIYIVPLFGMIGLLIGAGWKLSRRFRPTP